jgi:hypothetical protein
MKRPRRFPRRVVQKLGLDLTILSGDRLAAVAPVAKELGIANWQAGIITTLGDLKWG